MPEGIGHSVSCTNYWYNNKTNTTLVGIEGKMSSNRLSAAIFNGVALDTKDGGSMVVDLKFSQNYDKNGIIGQNLRIRNNFGDNTISTQIRYSPCTVNVPVTDSANIYLNPHGTVKYNYISKKWNTGVGAFLGVSQKFKNDFSVSIEGQRYNIQKPAEHDGNWGINVIVSKKF